MGSARGVCSLGSDSARASIVFTSLYLRSTSSITVPHTGFVETMYVRVWSCHAIGRWHSYLLYKSDAHLSLHRGNVYGSQGGGTTANPFLCGVKGNTVVGERGYSGTHRLSESGFQLGFFLLLRLLGFKPNANADSKRPQGSPVGCAVPLSGGNGGAN